MIAKHLEMSKKSRNFAALMPMTMNKFIQFLTMLCMMTAALTMQAADYTMFLTQARGFVEITSTSDIPDDANYYYILASAENTNLIVGVGAYEAKPDWASTESKALRYKSADTDPVLDLTNFFTIEKSGIYIGLRNVVYSADLFQTHDNAGYMYVNTYTDKSLDEWSYLIPMFQDGYWTFENGKYPMSSDNWACGYLGPWNDNVVAGDALALNKRENAIGHYRLFRIAKADLRQTQMKALRSASTTNPLNATCLITNPSFETGDETGWTLIGKDPNGNDEFKVRGDYGMTGKEGMYLFNAYQWWSSNIGVTQTVDVPSGEYTLSGVVCTWANRNVFFIGNSERVDETGINDATGIPVSLNVNVGMNSSLIISAGSNAEWWNDGHGDETQTFFKLDDVRLICKGLYLNGVAQPLPNDNSTILEAGQWYYYDVTCSTEYLLKGNLNNMVYSTDGGKLLSEITTSPALPEMTFSIGRVYFKTTDSNSTLVIMPKREVIESEHFTACALNVDGLPESILFVTLNKDGPQSEGTKKISTYLNSKAYDIMGFSEDFNFDTELRSNMSGYTWGTHRGKITGLSNNTDGLQFACKNSSVTWANESYIAYTSTASTDGNQYVKKGYRHYDVTIGDQLIDVYITHMDAGSESASITSRNKQWKQLTDAINAVDNGRETPRPKIVMGDTNCRWTRDGMKANFLDQLNSNFTASDVWVEFCRDGVYPTTDMSDLTDQGNPTNYTNYEIVDKIIYINPKAANTLQLVPHSFKIEQDYIYDTIDHDGNTKALGDHNPVVVEFSLVKSGELISLLGDVNRDGKVDIADLTALVNYLITHEGDYDLEAADMNHDGDVTLADVEPLVNLLLAE